MDTIPDFNDIPGNPNLGNYMKLYCERGYNLTIRQGGQVLGTQDDADPDTNLEILTAHQVGKVQIKGLNTQLYLCFDCCGQLYGEEDRNNEATVFEEFYQGSYNTYRSVTYPCWYVAIKKSGVPKNGNRTAEGQKAIKFLPRRLAE